MKFKVEMTKIRIDPSVSDKVDWTKFFGGELQNTSFRLRQNIATGKGSDGQEIKPGGYSKSYLEQIEKKQAKGRGVTKTSRQVNLAISSDLLNSIQVKMNGKKESQLYFFGQHYSGNSNSALAKYLYDKGYVGWFYFGKDDVSRIVRNAGAVLTKISKTVMKIG